jgi:hypothetical protein
MNPISYELAVMQRDERLRQAAAAQLASQARAKGRAPMHAATPRRRALRRLRRLRYALLG